MQLTQTELDDMTTAVNAFLATLTTTNVLDVKTDYMPAGKYGAGSAYVTTVIYQE